MYVCLTCNTGYPCCCCIETPETGYLRGTHISRSLVQCIFFFSQLCDNIPGDSLIQNTQSDYRWAISLVHFFRCIVCTFFFWKNWANSSSITRPSISSFFSLFLSSLFRSFFFYLPLLRTNDREGKSWKKRKEMEDTGGAFEIRLC